jgi:hypothetical protein
LAYAAAIFGGKLLVPVARPFLKMPDQAVSILAGAILALLVYSIVSSLGRIFFKRTNQHSSGLSRLVHGASGALLGFIIGAFLVAMMIIGVRSVGSIADGGVRAQAATQPVNPGQNILSQGHSVPKQEPPPLVSLLARLKNSIELGTVGEVVKKTDPVPEKAYDTLAKAGQVLGNPESAERFLDFPGARELSEHPKIAALRNDPEIVQLAAQGRFFELLQNEKILEAARDPALLGELKKLDVQSALEYATKATP